MKKAKAFMENWFASVQGIVATERAPMGLDEQLWELEQNVRFTLDATQNLALRKQMGAQIASELLNERNAEYLGKKIQLLSERLGPTAQNMKELTEGVPSVQSMSSVLAGDRIQLISIWLSLPNCIDFLVWLREQCLKLVQKKQKSVIPLEQDIFQTLSVLFSQGLLVHKNVDWSSSAYVLENIMQYEQVHKMSSWEQLRARLGTDRQIHAFFHPSWNHQPVAFVEIALTKGIAKNISDILESHPMDAAEADSAMFYSINSPHEGLKGISFGEELIKKSATVLKEKYPKLKNFCTLSPIPSLSKWLDALSEVQIREKLGSLPGGLEKQFSLSIIAEEDFYKKHLAQRWGSENEALMRHVLSKLTIQYLKELENGRPLDPVARFHLGNGAKLENVCFAADMSEKGWRNSKGMMVNYLYDLEAVARNQKLLQEGVVKTSLKIKWLGR